MRKRDFKVRNKSMCRTLELLWFFCRKKYFWTEEVVDMWVLIFFFPYQFLPPSILHAAQVPPHEIPSILFPYQYLYHFGNLFKLHYKCQKVGKSKYVCHYFIGIGIGPIPLSTSHCTFCCHAHSISYPGYLLLKMFYKCKFYAGLPRFGNNS